MSKCSVSPIIWSSSSSFSTYCSTTTTTLDDRINHEIVVGDVMDCKTCSLWIEKQKMYVFMIYKNACTSRQWKIRQLNVSKKNNFHWRRWHTPTPTLRPGIFPIEISFSFNRTYFIIIAIINYIHNFISTLSKFLVTLGIHSAPPSHRTLFRKLCFVSMEIFFCFFLIMIYKRTSHTIRRSRISAFSSAWVGDDYFNAWN